MSRVLDKKTIKRAEAEGPVGPPRVPSRTDQSLIPLMGQRHLDAILAALPAGGRMLEWGLGGSTLYFAKHLPAGASLLSIDHDPAWAARVQEAIASEARGARVEVRACPPTKPVGQTGTPVEEQEDHLVGVFLDAPKGERFDVILVDGWARNTCLRRARSMLKPSGVVFVHDAQRDWYDEAKQAWAEHGHLGSCPEYPIPQLWFAGMRDPEPAIPNAGPRDMPLIVSFYTTGTPYEAEARHLIASCERLGLEHDIRGLPNQGSWVANCAMKAKYVSERWYEHRRPLLWVDADATVTRLPSLLARSAADFAVHKRDGYAFRSGTLFFNDTPLAEELLGRWRRRCDQHPMVWDQVSLDLAWEEMIRDRPLRTLWLPTAYCKVTGENRVEPVIEHQLASTRHRDAMSGDVRSHAQPPHETVQRARRASRDRSAEELAAAGESGAQGSLGTQGAALTASLRDTTHRLHQQRDQRLGALRRADELRWRLFDNLAIRLVEQGIKEISLFGAGRHTELIIREPWASRGIAVVSVLDDAPRVPALCGVPVSRPSEATRVGQAIVVSSDAHEPALLESARSHFACRAPVHAIYGSFTADWPRRVAAEAMARVNDLARTRPGACAVLDLGKVDEPHIAVTAAAQKMAPGDELLVVAPLVDTIAAGLSRTSFTRSTLGMVVDRVFAQRQYLGQLYAGEPRTHVYPPGIYELEDFDAPRPDALLVICREPIQA